MSDATVYSLATDGNNVVISAITSNMPQPGMVAVSPDVYVAVQSFGVGRCTFDGSTVVAYVPPPPPSPAPTVTGNQWAFALNTLGLASAWQVGVTKSKSSDQVRAGLIARDTPLVVTDPLLIRIAANAGTDANGNPLITVPVVFATAQGMPL